MSKKRNARHAYVTFAVDVDQGSMRDLLRRLEEAAERDVRELHLLLSTSGGRVDCGVTIYNALRGLPCKLITHNIGNVTSIGNTIFLAGDERRACPSAQFMMHRVTAVASGNANSADLDATLLALRQDRDRLADIMCARTGVDRAVVEGWYDSPQTTMNAADAMRFGIVHEIRELEKHKRPDGAFVCTIQNSGTITWSSS